MGRVPLRGPGGAGAASSRPPRRVPPPRLCPRNAATSGTSHGGCTGGGVAVPVGRGLRTARARLLRLQGGQHPGQVGVAGEVPGFGECPPTGPWRHSCRT